MGAIFSTNSSNTHSIDVDNRTSISENNMNRDESVNTQLISENDIDSNVIQMRDQFIQRLDALGHNGKELCDLLVQDHTVIAGSFAMQVLGTLFLY